MGWKPRRLTRDLTVGCLVLFGLSALPASAQVSTHGAQGLSPVDFISLSRLSDPVLSPDGKHILYLKSHTNWGENKKYNRYVLRDLATQDALSTFDPFEPTSSVSDAVWLPDGRSFITLLKQDADKDVPETDKAEWSRSRQAYQFDIQSKTLTRLTNHPTDVGTVTAAPDGSGFYFLAQEERDAKQAKLLKRDFAIRPYTSNFADHLWFFDFNTGQTEKIIASDGFYLRGYSLSRDGQAILHMRSDGPLRDDRQRGDLYVYERETGLSQRVTQNSYAEARYSLSPDRKKIAYIATVNAAGIPYYEDNIFVHTIGQNQPELVLPNRPMEMVDVDWGETSDALFILGDSGLRTQLYHYDLKRADLTALTEGDHVISDWRYNPDTAQHSFSKIATDTPGTMMVLGKDGTTQTVSKLHNDLKAQFKLPRQDAFKWSGRDGQKLEGLLVYPLDYQSGTPFPLVTITHGGPRSSSQFGSWNTSRAVPVLANNGYGVFLPNHRGGTGYGDAFMRDMVGGYFTNAHLDVLDGIDALATAGLADPDALIKQGWSAGGHMTNMLITVTDRFKAASSGAGVADWISMYGESDIRFNRTPWFGGAPWQENAPLETYIQHSPLNRAWNIATPTLFWNGKEDERVPPTQGILMYRATKAAGVETQLYLAPGQPHGFRVPGYQLFKINTELAWYAKHLGRDIPEPDLPAEATE